MHLKYALVIKFEIDITNEIAKAGIKPKVIFYGTEEITTKNVFWKIYALIKKLTPHFVQFYRLPVTKLHGIITRCRDVVGDSILNLQDRLSPARE